MSDRDQSSQQAQVFATPWARTLRGLTTLSILILVGLVVLAIAMGPAGNTAWVAALLIPTILALAAASYFTIRRYEITPHALLVKRLGWTTRVDLQDLESVQADPLALSEARRAFGEGRLSLFFNTYDNPRLGRLETYGRQKSQAVVLRFPERTVVVTPSDPERMVGALDQLIKS